jgi:hypothetical protein
MTGASVVLMNAQVIFFSAGLIGRESGRVKGRCKRRKNNHGKIVNITTSLHHNTGRRPISLVS